jgi:hypothetical protein
MDSGIRTLGRRLRAALVAGGLATAVATATVAAPVLAADQPTTTQTPPTPPTTAAERPIHGRQVHGVVEEVKDATTFVLRTEKHGKVTVEFKGATVKGRGHDRGKARAYQVASVQDLAKGDRVVALGHLSEDATKFVAKRVYKLPTKVAKKVQHTTGTFAAYTRDGADKLTITLADGTTQSFSVTPQTRVRSPDGLTLVDVANLSNTTKLTVVSKDGTATAIVIPPTAPRA